MRKHIPRLCHSLFWDVRPGALDLDKHSHFIMARILEFGSMPSVRWLTANYGETGLRKFFGNYYARRLSPKTVAFWKVVLKLGEAECRRISSARRKYPFWPH